MMLYDLVTRRGKRELAHGNGGAAHARVQVEVCVHVPASRSCSPVPNRPAVGCGLGAGDPFFSTSRTGDSFMPIYFVKHFTQIYLKVLTKLNIDLYKFSFQISWKF